MLIQSPLCITSRLMVGFQLGGAEVSIGYSDRPGRDRRTRYEYFIDIGKREFRGDDLQSGAGGGGLQSGLESLVSFLGAAAEALDYETRTGRASDNADLFPRPVVEWACANSDELGMIGLELEETPGLIEE